MRPGSSGARRRAHVQMSPAEVAGFLDSPLTMVLATPGAAGFPHQAAMFYVMDGSNPVFWSYRRSQKIVNIERDPRVSCLVEDGADYRELRGVLLAGHARLSVDPGDIERTARLLAEKYTGPVTPGDLANFRRQADKRCVVTVDVVRRASQTRHDRNGKDGVLSHVLPLVINVPDNARPRKLT
jgi:PPOX class probable F420-dependent enzyme